MSTSEAENTPAGPAGVLPHDEVAVPEHPHPSPARARPNRPGPAGPPRLDSLTGLRFFAAIMVVVHHTVANDVNGGHLVTIPFLRPLATIGFTGVTFFFVLSGFVLAWSARPGDTVRDFLARRVARVYPMHVLTWVLAFPVLIYIGKDLGFGTAVLCLFLLQAWSPNSSVTFGMNALSWSLSCEAFFYAAFPVLIRPLRALSVRRLMTVVSACVGVLVLVPVVAYGIGGRGGVAIFYYFPAYRIFEFVIGMCLALAVKHGWRPRLPSWSGPAGVLVCIAVALLGAVAYRHAGGGAALPRVASALIMLPGFMLLIVTAAVRDLSGAPSIFARPNLVRLGAWSFALYLTHHLVLITVESALGTSRPHGLALNVAIELLALVIAVVISALAYRLVEHPVERFLRLRLVSRRGIGPASAPGRAQAR